MEKKKQDEEDFKAKVMAKVEGKKEYGNAWDTMALATDNGTSHVKERFYRRLDSDLADLASTIVEYVAEVKKSATGGSQTGLLYHAMTALSSGGSAIVIGGNGSKGALASAEVYK